MVPVRSDPVRSAYNRRRHGDLDVGHPRSRAVIGESHNLPAADVALLPVGAAAPGPSCAAPAVGGMGHHEAGSPGVSVALGGVVWRLVRAVSSVVFVSPRSGEGATAGHRVPLRQRMRAARKLLFGPARTAGG